MSLFGDEEFFDDLPVDHHSCRLLGPTALIVQGLMGLLVISSLVYKRHRETPKRPWRIWFFDVSKQVTGQLFVHGGNVLISGIVARLSSGNACVLYFLNILIDTTLGVAIIYLVLHLFTHFLTEKCGFKGFESGQYGTPPLLSYWLRQTTVYVLALTIMKLLVVGLFALWPGIFKLGEWLLSFLGDSDAAQIIFTMGLFPIMMNVIQFWLIDSIVKASANTASVALPSDSTRNSIDPDIEPLFRASMDDDDDGHPRDIENQLPLPRSRSRSRDSGIADEPKSSAATSATAAGSGSVTPKIVDNSGVTTVVHAYPPSVASTSSSPASSRPNSISRPKRKRSPPPPLALQPIPHMTQASLPRIERSQGDKQPEGEEGDEKEWTAWDDGHGDDWADRVGEDEWTGRRVDARKANLRDAWTEDGYLNST